MMLALCKVSFLTAHQNLSTVCLTRIPNGFYLIGAQEPMLSLFEIGAMEPICVQYILLIFVSFGNLLRI